MQGESSEIPQQSNKQTLSTQQLQYLRLLAMNAIELNSYLEELHMENPVVELVPPASYLPAQCTAHPLDVAHWVHERSVRVSQHNPDATNNPSLLFDEGFEEERYNLQSYLRSQFDLSLSDLDLSLMDRLIHTLDANGFVSLQTDQLVCEGFDRDLIREGIGYLQMLEPAGIGARDLKECLKLQLIRRNVNDPVAFLLVDAHLEDLALGHFGKIAKTIGCDVDRIKQLYRVIKTLNPRPAAGFGNEAATYIIPDITIFEDGDVLRVRYNKQYNSQISINRSYLDLADGGDEARHYITKKLSQAMWVIRAVESRQATIERIVTIIVEHQRAFFLDIDGAIAPLRLKDVASRISVHESTVSRAINEKYLECKRGIFPLKYFFSNTPVGEPDGNEAVSAKAIKERIRQLVASEQKTRPLSDSAIASCLSAEGMTLARRTVTKYREELGILSSTARKHSAF